MLAQARARVWEPFLRGAIGSALSAGFALGGVLFLAHLLGWPLGPWWLASAQAHGHVQLFGWAGLMVLGVGFHFLPRFRGAALARPERTRLVFWLLLVGLALRALAQPLLTLALPVWLTVLLRTALVGSGMLELAGVSLAVSLLAGTLPAGPPLRERPGLQPVLPFFVVAFTSLWLALALNALGVVLAVSSNALIPPWFDQIVVLLALYGFLVPVSVAMSARTFPIYFRTPLAASSPLLLGLGLLLVGLASRVAGELAVWPTVPALGRLGQAGAILAFLVGLGVFARRRTLPRQVTSPLADPLQLHAVSAYAWLALAALGLLATSLSALGLPTTTISFDVERHLLGAGFVTLLILGMAGHLITGFSGQPLRSRALTWLTLALGNVAAALRVLPLLAPGLFSPALASALLATAGLAGLAAVAAFAVNLSGRRIPTGTVPLPVVEKAGARR